MSSAIGRVALVACALALLAAFGCAPTRTTTKATDGQLKALRDSAQASYDVGQQYFAQQDYPMALRNFKASVVYDSTFYEAYIAMGALYSKMRDTSQAEVQLRKALAIRPDLGRAYFELGEIRVHAADQKLGKGVDATPMSGLVAAKRLYEEAKGYHSKAAADPACEGESRVRLQHVDEALQSIFRSQFFR